MPKQAYMLPDYTGLNTEAGPEVLTPGQLSTCDNWDLARVGRLIKRFGSALWSTAAPQSIRRLGFLRGTDGDPDYLLVLTTSGAYYGDATTDWPPASFHPVAISGSSGVVFYSTGQEAVFQDSMFLVGSSNPAVIQDNLTYRNAYLPQPSTGPKVSATAIAGNPSGSFSYQMTFVSSRRAFRDNIVIESNPSDATGNVAVSSKKMLVDSLPVSADADAVAKRIYRKISTGVLYYQVAEIPNATTAIEDNVSNTGYGVEMHDETHAAPIGLISNPTHLEAHRNRLFAAGDGFDLAYTEIEAPYYWGYSTASGLTTNVLTLSAEQEEGQITGLASSYDSLMAFTRKGIWEITGDDPDTYSIMKVENIGCIAPDSIAKSPYGVFFLSSRGVELWDGQQATELSTPIRRDILSLLTANARGIWFIDRYLIRFNPTTIYAFWPDRNAWARYTMPTTAWENLQMVAIPRGEQDGLYGPARSDDQRIVKLLNGTSDEATDITADAKTGYLDLGVPYRRKYVKRTQLEAEARSDPGAMNLEVNITPGGTDGQAVTASWSLSTATRQYAYGLPAGAVGDDFQVEIKHVGQQDVEVRRLNLEYDIREGSRR